MNASRSVDLSKPIPVHPLAAAIPVMSEDELEILAEDIRENGLQQPITLLDGKILDGNNRHKACLLIGYQFQPGDIENFDDADQDPTTFVISRNIARRHLTPGQRSALAIVLGQQRERQRAAAQLSHSADSEEVKHRSRASAQVQKQRQEDARAAGVGVRTMKQAEQVQKAAPKEFKKLLSGETSIRKAIKAAQGKKPLAKKPYFLLPLKLDPDLDHALDRASRKEGIGRFEFAERAIRERIDRFIDQ